MFESSKFPCLKPVENVFKTQKISNDLNDQIKKLLEQKKPRNIGNISELKLQALFQKGQKCLHCSKKLLYLCMETQCKSDRWLCPQCDVFKLYGKHFNHNFSYVNMFLKDINRLSIKKWISETKNFFEKHQKKLTSLVEITKSAEKTIINSMYDIYNNSLKLQNKQHERLKNVNSDFDTLQSVLNDLDIDPEENTLNLQKQIVKSITQGINKIKQKQKVGNQCNKLCEALSQQLLSSFKEVEKNMMKKKHNFTEMDNTFFFAKNIESDQFRFQSIQLTQMPKKQTYLLINFLKDCRQLTLQQDSPSNWPQTDYFLNQDLVQINMPNLLSLKLHGQAYFPALNYINAPCLRQLSIKSDFFVADLAKNFKNIDSLHLRFSQSNHNLLSFFNQLQHENTLLKKIKIQINNLNSDQQEMNIFNSVKGNNLFGVSLEKGDNVSRAINILIACQPELQSVEIPEKLSNPTYYEILSKKQKLLDFFPNTKSLDSPKHLAKKMNKQCQLRKKGLTFCLNKNSKPCKISNKIASCIYSEFI